MKICFIILHYLTDEDTLACIESIERLQGAAQSEIYIVDNYSNNGSIERVHNAIQNKKNCHIIYCNENLGYARGNNIGYQTAKKAYENSFMVIMNNDTIIKQTNFIELIFNSYNRNSFHVMGPDIISLTDGGHQNPMKNACLTKGKLVKTVIKYTIWLFLSQIGLFEILQKKYRTISKYEKIETEKGQYEELNNKALHGSCLIFSPEFVKNNDIPFNPGTFLYMEEAILALKCQQKGYNMVYDPSIEIFHKEDSATNQIVTTAKAKREMLFKNFIKSAKVYWKAYNE